MGLLARRWFYDLQAVFSRYSVVGNKLAEAHGLEVEAIMIVYEVRIGGHGNEPFPSIGHKHRGLHVIGLAGNDDFGSDGVPAERLLLRVESNLDGIKVVGVTNLLSRSEIRDLGGAAGQEGQNQKR